MISVQTRTKDAYSPEQVRLVENIAAQAALAIDKASLFDQLQVELEKRQKLVTELKNKNDELEHFTYTVSHDLRAPLVTIRGFMGYLDKDLQAGNLERARSDASRITRSADNMQNMLEKLLALSRAGLQWIKWSPYPWKELSGT